MKKLSRLECLDLGEYYFLLARAALRDEKPYEDPESLDFKFWAAAARRMWDVADPPIQWVIYSWWRAAIEEELRLEIVLAKGLGVFCSQFLFLDIETEIEKAEKREGLENGPRLPMHELHCTIAPVIW